MLLTVAFAAASIVVRRTQVDATVAVPIVPTATFTDRPYVLTDPAMTLDTFVSATSIVSVTTAYPIDALYTATPTLALYSPPLFTIVDRPVANIVVDATVACATSDAADATTPTAAKALVGPAVAVTCTRLALAYSAVFATVTYPTCDPADATPTSAAVCPPALPSTALMVDFWLTKALLYTDTLHTSELDDAAAPTTATKFPLDVPSAVATTMLFVAARVTELSISAAGDTDAWTANPTADRTLKPV